jgi:hypothetical protein
MDAEGKVNFGNVLNTSIEEIWNSKYRSYYIEAHYKHMWNVIELCKNCTGS